MDELKWMLGNELIKKLLRTQFKDFQYVITDKMEKRWMINHAPSIDYEHSPLWRGLGII